MKTQRIRNAGGLLKPPALRPGARVGVFAPSHPAHVHFAARYRQGLAGLRAAGFEVVEGPLTGSGRHEGYRTAGPVERAEELMGLWLDPSIEAIVCVIGGQNSSSLLPHLDFAAIGERPKVFCGYSDVTALHLALGCRAGVSTFYGPAVVPSFGEAPSTLPYTLASFLAATGDADTPRRRLEPPARFSREGGDWRTDDWKDPGRRVWHDAKWTVVRGGVGRGPLIAANLNTLRALAGTPFMPRFEGAVLLIEEMDAPLSRWERAVTQLRLMGVFEKITALLVGRPERPDCEGARFDHTQVLLEVISDYDDFPVIEDFDCGHTHPQMTLAQGTEVSVRATAEGAFEVWAEEAMVGPPREG